VWVSGEADGRDPGGALMQQNAKEKQMQDSGRGGVFRAARRCCDWFADRLDVCVLLLPAFGIFVEAG
jgi:hypothetical protein